MYTFKEPGFMPHKNDDHYSYREKSCQTEGLTAVFQIFPRPLRIFSGLIGQLLTHTPQASWIAIPMAGAAPLHAISLMDFAPNGPSGSSTSIRTLLKSSGAS